MSLPSLDLSIMDIILYRLPLILDRWTTKDPAKAGQRKPNG
jgi:hypothetical protein